VSFGENRNESRSVTDVISVDRFARYITMAILRNLAVAQLLLTPVLALSTINTKASRRSFLATTILYPATAQALVKGNAPPPKASVGEKPKCRNVEECQAAAEIREQQEREAAQNSAEPTLSTKAGTRYRDLQAGSGAMAKEGDGVKVYYKVLKLGKRSYDGLSGEGTVVFSRGYGLEDDEKKPGDKSFITDLGSMSNIKAFNDAVVGMQIGGIRRFAVLPPSGWRKPERACDGGPGGEGQGGDLKTDYVVVPTATIVAAEACFDSTKQPFPTTYAQQRRMAQRFDQSLIMEVELVEVGKGL